MSTKLRTHPDLQRFTLTRYWGGDELGGCVQITGPNSDKQIGYVGVTRKEALALAHNLMDFACGAEEED